MKVYCEHGALSKSLRELQRKGFIELVHFPYDPDSRSGQLAMPELPSAAQWWDLKNLTWAELPGTFQDYSGSEHFTEILEILGSENRRDALHVDTAVKNGCSAFVTCDNDILSQKGRLETALGIRFFHTENDRDELDRFICGGTG
jgi:predicted nucleic acid-binding protein